MPRSRTIARDRDAKLAAGLIQADPERTKARVRAWWRLVWKRTAAYEDNRRGREGWSSPLERKLTIRISLELWLKGALAELDKRDEAAAKRGR